MEENRKPILTLVEKRESILAERDTFERNKIEEDKSRLTARDGGSTPRGTPRKRDVGRLLREEKVRGGTPL
jgi:hypothetical protein